MNRHLVCSVVLWASTMLPSLGALGVEMLPGITFYKHSQQLSGRLLFVVGTNLPSRFPGTGSAILYEFDLVRQRLRTLASTPWSSRFFTSGDGSLICLIVQSNLPATATNAFVWSEKTHSQSLVALPGVPRQVAIAAQSVFFLVETENQSRIVVFDASKGRQERLELKNDRAGGNPAYDQLHVSEDSPDALHFRYSVRGRMPSQKAHRDGYYEFNPAAGTITWRGEEDDSLFEYRTFDGKYVFFAGSDSPIRGSRLILSPWNNFETEDRDPRGKSTKVIAAFSQFGGIFGGGYYLHQISPDKHFALVRLTQPAAARSTGERVWKNQYYIVDVLTGSTHILVKENVNQNASNMATTIVWVSDEKSEL